MSPAYALPRHVVVIAKHFGTNFAGEAIKAYQFAEILADRDVELTVITHQNAIDSGGTAGLDATYLIVPDSRLQSLLWRSRVLRFLLDPYFHLAARRMVISEIEPGPDTVLHYLSPVSPVALRFVPKGYEFVMGPLTGNIYYPPAFRDRMSLGLRTAERLHAFAQRVQRRIYPEKRRARTILVSGYERTRVSLKLAGTRDDQMVDVVDAGVSDHIAVRPRITHTCPNPRFVCSGRMVDHKGTDLAIKAVAAADPTIELDIYGDGEKRAGHEALAAALGVTDRVHFKGWMNSHDDLIDALGSYRGYVFPSLAEANGIVMQEAMMLGLPVIAARWGGPAMLADDDSAVYLPVDSEDELVEALAQAMNRLAVDTDHAERLSINARRIAEERYTWEAVAESWLTGAYRHGYGERQDQTVPANGSR
ncbi:MAG: glycosyltransferase family 4 protein [Acidimicrobiales bacterium]